MQMLFQDFFLPKAMSLEPILKLFSRSFWRGLKTVVFLFAASALEPALVFAQQTNRPAGPSFGEAIMQMLPMFAMVMIIYYFMIAKPQQLKQKSHADLLASLKKGDSIVTTFGLFGKVASIEGDSVQIEIAPNVKVKLETAHVAKKSEAIEKA